MSWSHSSFKTFESIKNDSKARTLGAIRFEAKRHRTPSCHMWTAASTTEKEKVFCIVWWPVMKNGYTKITLTVENHWVNQAMQQYRWQSWISMVRSSCSAFGGISRVLFIMSCSHRPKPSREIVMNYKWYVWAEHWRKKWPLYEQRYAKVILQHDNEWKPTLKRLNGKSYPFAVFTRHCPVQLSLVPIDGTWLGWAVISFLWRCQIMSRLVVSLKRCVVFPTWNSNAVRNMGKSTG